jgi:chondroitin 4-sulfotransferase 11
VFIQGDHVIFVHIQKTGGTAINRALGVEDSPYEKHRSALELREIYGPTVWQDCFKFAFVRNPWDRLVSWWSMIDGQRTQLANSGLANGFFKYILENATTFEEFITNCTDTIHDADGVKCIFRNQIDYLRSESGEVLVDFIGRFETLNADFSRLTERVYGTAKPLEVVNSSEHSQYQDYYNSKTSKIVEAAYHKDIEYFGYRFEG